VKPWVIHITVVNKLSLPNSFSFSFPQISQDFVRASRDRHGRSVSFRIDIIQEWEDKRRFPSLIARIFFLPNPWPHCFSEIRVLVLPGRRFECAIPAANYTPSQIITEVLGTLLAPPNFSERPDRHYNSRVYVWAKCTICLA
jgi:hypothetical protein